MVNRYESNMFKTVAGALTFLDERGDPRIKLHVDTYHVNIDGERPPLPGAGRR